MKKSPLRWLKKTYRKERFSAFVLTFGLIDALLGGVDGRWTLLSFGLFVITIGLLMRWLQEKNLRKPVIMPPARRYLPPSANGLTPLPPLKRKRDYRF